MPASDLLKASIAKFKLSDADQKKVFAFFDQKVADPTVYLDDNTVSYYVSQDPEVQQIFDTRFAGNKALRDAGRTEYSYSSYIAREEEFRDDLRNAGFPPGFYDDTESIGKLIAGEVSRSELQDRAAAAYTAVRQADPNTVQEIRSLYGWTDADLAAYFLDPAKAVDAVGKRLTGQDLVRRVQAGQISAQARQQAGMGLTAQQAEQLGAQGITEATARQGFAQIAQQRGLFEPQMTGEETLSQQEQISGVLGLNAEAAQRIATRRRRRQAEFEAGGGFAASQTGLAGLRTVGQ